MDIRPSANAREPDFCYWDYFRPSHYGLVYMFSVRATHYDAAIRQINALLEAMGRTRQARDEVKMVSHIPTHYI